MAVLSAFIPLTHNYNVPRHAELHSLRHCTGLVSDQAWESRYWPYGLQRRLGFCQMASCTGE